MAVKTRIIRIGNSQGVRIPKPLLEQSGLTGEVELAVEGDRIVIQSIAEPRHGWPAAFERMAREGTTSYWTPMRALQPGMTRSGSGSEANTPV